jgi:hypothetical protein
MTIDSSLSNSRPLQNGELSWLHDARVPTITFDSTGTPSLRFVIDVNYEAGSPAWDGTRILVIAADVHCLAMRTYPVAGIETINIFDVLESETFQQERLMGMRDLVEYGIAFQSGAELSFMCSQLLVAVTDG